MKRNEKKLEYRRSQGFLKSCDNGGVWKLVKGGCPKGDGIRYWPRKEWEYYREKELTPETFHVLDEFMRQLWSKKDMPEQDKQTWFDILRGQFQDQSQTEKQWMRTLSTEGLLL